MISAITLTLLFGAADFVTGRDYFSRLKIPGRSVWYVTPALCGLLALVQPHIPWVWTVGLAWGLWRGTLGWSTFGGRMDVRTYEDGLKMYARDTISVIPTLVALYFVHWAPGGQLAIWCMFVTFATLVNAWFGWSAAHGQEVDPAVDFLHGAGYGLALYFSLEVA